MNRLLSPSEARSLTEEIKASPETRWSLVGEAYNSGVWSALNYTSWEDYCAGEFGAERLRLPWRKRREVLTYLQEAGLPFQAIESVSVRRRPGGLPMVVDSGDAAAEPVEARPDRQLGFTHTELSLLGSLLSVSDAEFEQVLAEGNRTGNLTGPFIEAACWGTSQGRISVESNLKRATKALDRAGDLIARCDPALTPLTPAMDDLLRGLEDRAWDVLDEMDDLKARFDANAQADRDPGEMDGETEETDAESEADDDDDDEDIDEDERHEA